MSVVVIQYAEGDGRKDAGKVKEERRGKDLLRRLDARQSVLVIGDVVG